MKASLRCKKRSPIDCARQEELDCLERWYSSRKCFRL